MLRRTFLVGAGAAGVTAACASAPETPAPASVSAAEAKYPPIGRIYDVGNQKVHATDQGAGRPIIMIHGASGNLRDFTFDLTEPLASTNRVIAMDRPGFGYSTRSTDKDAWRPAAQAAQLRAAAKQMGVEKPILVGHSWGASVALAWAMEDPENVSGVVTASGAMMPWGGAANFFASLGLGDLVVSYYNRSLSRRAETGGIRDFISRAFQPQVPPAGYIDYVGGELAVREKTLEANGKDLANLQVALKEMAPRYASLNMPVEVMHGDRDWLLGFDQHAEGIAALLPDPTLTRLPGVGHMAHHARPEVLNDAIRRIEAATT